MQPLLVIGCGSIGRRHLRNLRTLGVENLIAYDPLPDCREQAHRESGAQVVETLQAGLAMRPRAALVCTPPHLHLAAARQSLDAGAHLFIEKPISHLLDGVADLLSSARQAGRLVVVGYNWRFHAAIVRLKDMLQAGAVGKPLMIRAEVGQYLPDWRPTQDYRAGYNVSASMGGGIILDASHELDYVRWLGGEVKNVFCAAGHLSDLQMDTEDSAALVMGLSGGTMAEIHLDCIQRGYARNCKIIGSEGTLVWEYSFGVRWLAAGDKTWREFPIMPDPNDMYVAEMRHFLACIQDDETPLVNGETGRRVLEIALAAKESARREQTVSLR